MLIFIKILEIKPEINKKESRSYYNMITTQKVPKVPIFQK
jgi:hypothetical protein